jgi:hypothetical protein
VGAVHRAQVEVGLREHNLGPPTREQDDIMFPSHVHSKSFILIVRATLEGQIISRDQYRALLGLEGQISGHPWKLESQGMSGHILPTICSSNPVLQVSLSLILCVSVSGSLELPGSRAHSNVFLGLKK